MTNKYAIGIDLGTSTSEICIFRNNEPFVISDPTSQSKSPIVPSIVAVNKRGEPLIGEDARSTIDLLGHGIREVKRKMGSGETVRLLNKEYRPEEIAALILRKLKQNAEDLLGIRVTEVVLSVPAIFPNTARQATYDAGELAGLKIIRLISEPTAAALSFGISNIDIEEQLVVFDFGGGTLDISILEMIAGILEVKTSFGDPNLGGKDFDDAMMSLILRKFNNEVGGTISEKSRSNLKGIAEKAKINLSYNNSTLVQMANFAFKNNELVDLDIEVTRDEYERDIAYLLEKARACIRQALNAKKIRPSLINRIILVGGTTYIPAVRKLVTEMFGKEPEAEINPDLAVVMGASIEAAIAQGLIDQDTGIIKTDVSPYGLGVDMLDEVGGAMMLLYDPLIKPNTTIPYSITKNYMLLHTEQKELEVKLYQDPKGTARLADEAIDTGISAKITDIPPSINGQPHRVDVDFSYDISGLIKIHVKIPSSGQYMDIVYSHSSRNLNEEEKTIALVRVSELWKQSSKAKGYESIISKAEKLMDEISLKEKQTINMILIELKDALVVEDEKRIKTASDRLVDLMFDIENNIGG